MSSEKRRFRPMSITDILDETVDIYKSNFVLLVGVAAILYVPLTLLTSLTQDYTGHTSFDWRTLMSVLPEAIVTGALTLGVSERYLGRFASIAGCYRRILQPRVLGPLLGAMVIQYLIMLTPFLIVNGMISSAMPSDPSALTYDQLARLAGLGVLVVLAAVWMGVFGVKLLLVEPALITESRGAWSSIGRSWSLMKGVFWKAVGVHLIVILVLVILFLIIVMPSWAPVYSSIRQGEPVTLSMLVLPSILQTIFLTLMVPVLAAVKILFYYDVRIRKEGFDLEILANELHLKSRQSMSGGITALPQEKTTEPSSDGEQQ